MAILSFIPQVWSARLLQHLDDALAAKNFFNQDYSGDILDYGDAVKINQIGSPHIFGYNRGKDIEEPQELNTQEQILSIDQAKAFNFMVDDVDAAQMRTQLIDAALQRAGAALAQEEDEYLFSILAAAVAPANQLGAKTIKTPDAAFNLLIKLREVLTKNNVPQAGRVVALAPEFVSLLLGDARLSSLDGGQALQSGCIGSSMGFKLYEVNAMPAAANIIAGHSCGGALAGQILKTEAYRMEKRFADAVKGLAVYGAKVLLPGAYVSAKVAFA